MSTLRAAIFQKMLGWLPVKSVLKHNQKLQQWECNTCKIALGAHDSVLCDWCLSWYHLPYMHLNKQPSRSAASRGTGGLQPPQKFSPVKAKLYKNFNPDALGLKDIGLKQIRGGIAATSTTAIKKTAQARGNKAL